MAAVKKGANPKPSIEGYRDCECCRGRVERGECPLVYRDGAPRTVISRRSAMNSQARDEDGCPLFHRIGRAEMVRVANKMCEEENRAFFSFIWKWAKRAAIAIVVVFVAGILLSPWLRSLGYGC